MGVEAPINEIKWRQCLSVLKSWWPGSRIVTLFTVQGGAAILGPPKTRCLDRPVLASLEDLVPTGHFYRHLDATLDLGFVRNWVRDCYAARGRPSIDTTLSPPWVCITSI